MSVQEKKGTMNPVTRDQTDWYVSRFASFEKTLNGDSTSHIHAIRKAAMNQFAKLGFPTTKHEEWRFTSIAPIAREQFYPSLTPTMSVISKDDLEGLLVPGLVGHRIVFVNGHYAEKLSSVSALSSGVHFGSLASGLRSHGDLLSKHLTRYALYETDAFTALNTGFLQDGAFISVADKAVVEQPVYVIFISTGDDRAFASHPRNVILVGKKTQISIIEHYVALGEYSYLTNTVSEIVVGEGAVVHHSKIQQESMKSYHIDSTHIHQSAGSALTSNSISFGGALVRNNVSVVLDAEGIECTLNGLSLSTGLQHIDNHTTIDHAKPRCNSHELYKAILDGKSKGVFNGKIFVRKDAQKTDAKQTNKTLLLSDLATMNTKPQLEIFADDVKCTHGATVGYLDAESLFYLRSRGIGVDAARDMLTFAFASDVTNRITNESVRNHLDTILHQSLEQGRQSEE